MPLLIKDEVRGTVWAISHDDHRFDAEDARVLSRLGLVAGSIETARRLRESQRRQADSARDRIRNTMAIMRTLVRRSDDGALDFEAAAVAKLSSRVSAYAQRAVGRSVGDTVILWSLIANLLAGHGEAPGDRISLSGAHVALPYDIAGPLALAIHELLENAFDHGALTQIDGHVAMAWHVDRDDKDERLHLLWQESGGPPVSRPEAKGFGIELLRDGLPTLLEARTTLSFDPAGLCFELTMPLNGKDRPPHGRLGIMAPKEDAMKTDMNDAAYFAAAPIRSVGRPSPAKTTPPR